MKKMLKKWLEIPNKHDASEFVNKNDVKHLVEDAVFDALSPDLKLDHIFSWERCDIVNLRGNVEKYVKELAKDDTRKEAIKVISNIIDPESFIDSVVERIKRKQLD